MQRDFRSSEETGRRIRVAEIPHGIDDTLQLPGVSLTLNPRLMA